MGDDPYAPPSASDRYDESLKASRSLANRYLRAGTAILLAPALVNAACLATFAGPAEQSVSYSDLAVVTNVVAVFLAHITVWYFGLSFVERLVLLLPARRASSEVGHTRTIHLYRSMYRLPWLAAVGAVLWFIWLYGFYVLGVPFYVLSIPVGVVAHVTAACWYVPLFYRWYLLS